MKCTHTHFLYVYVFLTYFISGKNNKKVETLTTSLDNIAYRKFLSNLNMFNILLFFKHNTRLFLCIHKYIHGVLKYVLFGREAEAKNVNATLRS